jgi:ferredoxin
MTYIVNGNCIKCKLMDCVEVCPVDCFYEGENFLAIKPDECIDCGVCEPECPVDAIKADTDESAKNWLEINDKYSRLWPNITKRRPEDVPKDNEKWRDVSDKLIHLSERPGKGD